MSRDLPTSGDPRPGPGELARRLRAYMGYADRTLDEVAAELQAAGVSVSPSTVNRWARGQGAPSVFAARELGRLVEQAGLAAAGGGTAWLLGEAPVVTTASPALDRAVRAWHFRAADAALADALGERGIPAGYRAPLAELLIRLLEELADDPDGAGGRAEPPHPNPLPDGERE
ncbi:MAG: helix-turn-helix transcriptional regulator [Chloroflexota bacterium]|nr:helix-turn-helix transcriptional regulator [Chloroflexota bacterium]